MCRRAPAAVATPPVNRPLDLRVNPRRCCAPWVRRLGSNALPTRQRNPKWRNAPVRIEMSECINCDACLRHCPPQFGAIFNHGPDVVIVPELCSGCDKCLPACPVNCIYPFPEWETAGAPVRVVEPAPHRRRPLCPRRTFVSNSGDGMTASLLPGAEPWSHDAGPVGALCLHGFTGNPGAMRPVAEAFAAAGFVGRAAPAPRPRHHRGGHDAHRLARLVGRGRGRPWPAGLALRQGRRRGALDGRLAHGLARHPAPGAGGARAHQRRGAAPARRGARHGAGHGGRGHDVDPGHRLRHRDAGREGGGLRRRRRWCRCCR